MIPIPPLDEAHVVEKRLVRIETETHREEEEASETWWRTADLTRGEWLELAWLEETAERYAAACAGQPA